MKNKFIHIPFRIIAILQVLVIDAEKKKRETRRKVFPHRFPSSENFYSEH